LAEGDAGGNGSVLDGRRKGRGKRRGIKIRIKIRIKIGIRRGGRGLGTEANRGCHCESDEDKAAEMDERQCDI
jgi:hypothetical protein